MRIKLKADSHQTTLDCCQLDFFKNILFETSHDEVKRERPLELYRVSLEVTESNMEEEIATIVEKYVVIQVINYGSVIPPIVQVQRLFTLDEFSSWIYQRNKDLFSECIENLMYFRRLKSANA